MAKNFTPLLLLFSTFSYSQVFDVQTINVDVTIPEVALLSISNNETLLFYLQPIQEAGDKIKAISSATNNFWINYTASLSPNSSLKNLTAQIISGNVPAGTQLLLEASDYSGSGTGQLGISEGVIELQNTPKVLLSNIGGSYTGIGTNNGHFLLYTLNITNYSLLDYEDSTTLTVIYTLSDN